MDSTVSVKVLFRYCIITISDNCFIIIIYLYNFIFKADRIVFSLLFFLSVQISYY